MARVRSADPNRPQSLSGKQAVAIRRRLLAWYDRNRRDLPWRRRGDDPYAQWVAEIMLQQTRVETVLAYYERFLDRFPDVVALGGARQQTVLKYWEGLGYYRRAIHMHEAAKQVRKAGGQMPDTLEGLGRLPGIGDYTAAAIASIAFGIPAAAVDGNVCRVTARLAELTKDMTTPAGRAAAARVAEQLLATRRPGDFNQAIMDLGSAICTPRGVRCDRCPLRGHCLAGQSGRAEQLPIRDAVRKRSVPEVRLAVALVLCGDRVLLYRQPADGLWSGLWGFPSIESTDAGADRSLLSDHLSKIGVMVVEISDVIAEVDHRLTHRQLRFRVYGLCAASLVDVPPSWRWATPAARARLTMSTAHRKIEKAGLPLVCPRGKDREA